MIRPASERYQQERIQYWDDFAASYGRWERARHTYQARLTEIYGFLIPAGARVLEVGCGTGDLLAAVQPSRGVGVDFSPRMIDLARDRHRDLEFHCRDAHAFELGETFDHIILSDLVNDLWDVQAVLASVVRHCHANSRVIVNAYSRLWEGPRHLAEAIGMAKPLLPQNWLTADDIASLMTLAGLEPIRSMQEIACPVGPRAVAAVFNRFVVKVAPFRHLGVTNVLIARPRPVEREPVKVSVIVPARNEAGNIPAIFTRTPQMGLGTELVFVEGGSSDDTYAAIEREIRAHPEMDARLYRQSGRGKGDAVRKGFAEATGQLLMILDADLTVPPEDLPRFYAAWQSGLADFVNGVRLVYPMEDRAMRPLNFLGNKFFSLAFTWLLGQSVKDTLCGTKVLAKPQYEMIAANRAWFGELDPYGDFDLLFGAAKYTLRILDLPVRYRERTYGETNIRRWSGGQLLLRMVLRAVTKLKFV